MNTQSANQNDLQASVELSIRKLLVLWFAMLSSIGLYYVLTLFAGPREAVEPNNTLLLALSAVALSTTLLSFVMKSKLLARAVEQQQVQLVQQTYIVAWALTEVAALLGLLAFFVTGSPYSYILFIISALGQLLHFPRREHLINAWPRSPIV